jgi:aryl-alcohol dehydrogenase-like predicted oxidoreductase
MALGTGGASQLGQGLGLPEEASLNLVHRALELGVNTFDTGKYQQSEMLLGRALAGTPRDSYVLTTKFYPFAADGSLRPHDDFKAALDDSLTQLKTDHVDVYMLHGVPDARYPEVMERFGDAIVSVRQQVLATGIGITETEDEPGHGMLTQALATDIFDVIMVHYNLISPNASVSILPLAKQKDVGVMVMCAVRTFIARPELLRAVISDWKEAGLLARDAVPDDAPLDWVLGPGVDSVTDAAYKFAAIPDSVSTVLTGTGNIHHLETNVAATLGQSLPDEVVKRLNDTFIPVGRNVSVKFGVTDAGLRTITGVRLIPEQLAR